MTTRLIDGGDGNERRISLSWGRRVLLNCHLATVFCLGFVRRIWPMVARPVASYFVTVGCVLGGRLAWGYPDMERQQMTPRELDEIQARRRATTRFQWACMAAVVLIVLIVPSI